MDPKALHKFTYGMYVVGSRASNGRGNAQIANAAFQVTSEPPALAISINKQNLTHQLIRAGRVFTLSVLSTETPLAFIGQLGFKSGRTVDKLASVKYVIGRTGAPIIQDHAVACMEAELVSELDAGTHTIFVGRVVDAAVIQDAPPMTYEFYHEVKRGLSPATAPTYVKAQAEKEIHKNV